MALWKCSCGRKTKAAQCSACGKSRDDVLSEAAAKRDPQAARIARLECDLKLEKHRRERAEGDYVRTRIKLVEAETAIKMPARLLAGNETLHPSEDLPF